MCAPYTAPVVVQPRESSSPTAAQVMKSMPSPPYSSGTGMPIRSSSPSLATFSSGHTPASSVSFALGHRTSSQNSRTASMTACWSSVKVKSMRGYRLLVQSSSAGRSARHLLR